LFVSAAVTACLSTLDAEAQEMAPMLHNGSLMLIVQDKEHVEIRYETPRPGLSVTKGAIVFSGTRDNHGNYRGTAYTFKRDCPPAPYDVAGKVSDRGITLYGRAPVRAANSCQVIAGASNPNSSRLVFEYEPE
jgi:hypothetical protein